MTGENILSCFIWKLWIHLIDGDGTFLEKAVSNLKRCKQVTWLCHKPDGNCQVKFTSSQIFDYL